MNCFVCPLSKKQLTEPVVAADGYTYERAEIEKYFAEGKSVSPITGEELTDKSLVPNKTLKSLILNKSTQKLEQLSEMYMKLKAENIALVKPDLKPPEILDILKKVELVLIAYKSGQCDVAGCLKQLEPHVKALPEDDELLQEYILLAYWIGNYALAQPWLDLLGKNPLFDMLGPLLEIYREGPANLPHATALFTALEAKREPNLFRVRDLKYKAMALQAIRKVPEALCHYNAYEVFVPFDPSVYALFKARALKDANMLKELHNYQVDYFIKYGNFVDLANLK
jgi:hypothetical protein